MSGASVSGSSIFIDTNIWLYALSESQDKQKHLVAKALIRRTPRIVMSTQIVNEVSFNLIRKFQAGESDIRKLIRSFHRKYLVIELNRPILLHASDLRTAYSFSFWDSIVIASALSASAKVLYSEDMHDGLVVLNQLTIVNPLKAPSTP
jgi:predicted nucleic acid-binding protein